MDKHESINAIKDFMNYCKVTDGIEIKAEVEVYDDTELIHQGLANVYCSYDVGYMQYRVTIIWAFDEKNGSPRIIQYKLSRVHVFRWLTDYYFR